VTADETKVQRVLKDDGVFLYVTYRQPHFIKPILNREVEWDLEHRPKQSSPDIEPLSVCPSSIYGHQIEQWGSTERKRRVFKAHVCTDIIEWGSFGGNDRLKRSPR
jgi:hypothetical protein